MTIKQYAEILEYIFKNNGWNINVISDNLDCRKPMIKYVDSSFDTRDGHIWSVKFRGISANDKSFRVETDEEIAKVYEWLNKAVTVKHKVELVKDLMYKGCELHWHCIHCDDYIPVHCYSKEELENMECKGSKNV